MSNIFFEKTTPIARKLYNCQACENILAWWSDADIKEMTEPEIADFEIAKAHRFKILPGEQYIKQSGVYDGDFYTFRGIPAMVDICHKYELFNED